MQTFKNVIFFSFPLINFMYLFHNSLLKFFKKLSWLSSSWCFTLTLSLTHSPRIQIWYFLCKKRRNIHWRYCIQKMCSLKFWNLEKNHMCWSLFLKKFRFYQKKATTQMFSCEIPEIFKSTYFEKHLETTASGK